MSESPLLSGLQDHILTLTLNRPSKRNAIDSAMITSLLVALERAELDSDVRVVTIQGAGADFCAGADLRELLASADQSAEENTRDAARLGSVFTAIRALPKPVVALVHGRALAGGAGLATACDIVLASESAQFGYPEIQRGFVPAMVMTILRRVAGEKAAFELVATGRIINAPEAARLGLVSRVMADTSFAEDTSHRLSQLVAAGPSALALTKRLFFELDGLSFTEGIALGAKTNALARATPEFRSALERFLNP